MTLYEVFAREEAPPHAPSSLILRRLDALGAANVARLVAPAWGYKNPDQALERLSRYRAHLERGGPRDMPSSALFALLPVLGLAVEEIDMPPVD